MKKKLFAVMCLLLAVMTLFAACSSGAPTTDGTTTGDAATGTTTDGTTTGDATTENKPVATAIPTDYPDWFERKEDSQIGMGFKIGIKANKADAFLKQKPVAWVEDLENAEDEYGRTVCIWKLAGLTMKFEYTEEEIAEGITMGSFAKDLSDVLYASYAGDGKNVYIEVYDTSTGTENNNARFTLIRDLMVGESTKEDVKAAFPCTEGATGDYFYKGQFAKDTYMHDAFGKTTTVDGKEAYLYVYPVDNQKDDTKGTDGELYRSVYFVFNDAGTIDRMILQETPWNAEWDA